MEGSYSSLYFDIVSDFFSNSSNISHEALLHHFFPSIKAVGDWVFGVKIRNHDNLTFLRHFCSGSTSLQSIYDHEDAPTRVIAISCLFSLEICMSLNRKIIWCSAYAYKQCLTRISQSHLANLVKIANSLLSRTSFQSLSAIFALFISQNVCTVPPVNVGIMNRSLKFNCRPFIFPQLLETVHTVYTHTQSLFFYDC